uniref:Formiminotransferase N-terminal subdomain domain-containing protein n=1 Tax=Trieres chinensis TaxID=1514140 RepID=A0A7S1ZBJ7_TRICV|mmetsp:Transcript_21762/g.44052  ORF Transcript_21762/g.44052 Transcript_21762/m.44052 type:complete len:358 (+) Transcript_21762:134-1207(+)|eukprot:CAMPEP_0183299466 /NCGR_PEP_ID=MMETSP0160_2-20130417/6200_1 /TAXON_ID=2839 ORGANISM="Odontella Sinensis, Strain Grunow 1884" /NCGR_SAMPLE_ID=MMETSP0160_2 /ASSEMBLY_ACC=CAM_ASM_000250 /LENGTH=357 /DNA_ID=CAMNT_0025461721 /DNA_START=121 /DNA_END=1194 /DNA_ORIENTATION=+
MISNHAQKCLVACNVYVSAGRRHHAPLLLDVLSRCQERCRVLRGSAESRNGEKNKIAVIHAFADVPYDRSSFHLAGEAAFVAEVASLIARDVLTGLVGPKSAEKVRGEEDQPESRHPYVGVVDHVSVMPLSPKAECTRPAKGIAKTKSDGQKFIAPDPHGQAALAIGRSMSEVGAKVLYHGSSNPEMTPLADVRRESTNFFKSGGLLGARDTVTELTKNPCGIAIVGSPCSFVENFNVRLSNSCEKKDAISLAKALRERDGGLLGVEALTLPYSGGRFEVACNLLRPDVGSVDAISQVLDQWLVKNCGERGIDTSIIEDAYRVGTTARQCIGVLENAEMDEYDLKVQEQFQCFLHIA